jgi:hypothetical protein
LDLEYWRAWREKREGYPRLWRNKYRTSKAYGLNRFNIICSAVLVTTLVVAGSSGWEAIAVISGFFGLLQVGFTLTVLFTDSDPEVGITTHYFCPYCREALGYRDRPAETGVPYLCPRCRGVIPSSEN